MKVLIPLGEVSVLLHLSDVLRNVLLTTYIKGPYGHRGIGMSKILVGPAYTMGIICPTPHPSLDWKRVCFANLPKELEGISSLVRIRSTGPDPYTGET